jgi:membrane-bound serine protease (ClpP class)
MLKARYFSGILFALLALNAFADEVEKPGTEPSKGHETRTPFLPVISGFASDSSAVMPDSVYSNKTIKGKIPVKKKVYQFKIQDEINVSTLRQTEEMLVNAENMDVDFILIHLTAEGGNYSAANKIKNTLIHSKTPVLMYIDNKVETSGAIVSLGADSIITAKNIQIGKVTVTTDKASNKNKSYQYYVKTLLRNTASKTEMQNTSVTPNGKQSTSVFTDPYEQQYASAELNTALKDAGLNNYDIIEYETSRIGAFMDTIISEKGVATIAFIISGLLFLFFRSRKKGIALCLIFILSLVYFASCYFENNLSFTALLAFYGSLLTLVLSLAIKLKNFLPQLMSIVLTGALLLNYNSLLSAFLIIVFSAAALVGAMVLYSKLRNRTIVSLISVNRILNERNLGAD